MEINHWLEDWLSARAEAAGTKDSYLMCWRNLTRFSHGRGHDPSRLVQDYRAVKFQGEIQRETFLEEWQDILRAWNTWLKPRYAPFSRKNQLVAIRSFLNYWKIPLDLELPRHPYVLYHNRDLTKEQLKQILNRGSQRDRTIWLFMAESGLRAGTTIAMKYWQIQEDFEKDIVPMRIQTPSETLKDHVGDRWSFIGEDGARALREYLKPRMPLKGEDYVFASERPGRMVGEQFSVASLSVKFSRTCRALKLEKGSAPGKPGHFRMHGLRKYFRNNMRADPAYREFWMGHSIGVDAHYVSRDPEFHRAEYKRNYESLRIQEPATPAQLTEITDALKQKDREIQDLRKEVDDLKGYSVLMKKWAALMEKGDLIPRDPGKMLKAIAEKMEKSESPYQDEEESPGSTEEE